MMLVMSVVVAGVVVVTRSDALYTRFGVDV